MTISKCATCSREFEVEEDFRKHTNFGSCKKSDLDALTDACQMILSNPEIDFNNPALRRNAENSLEKAMMSRDMRSSRKLKSTGVSHDSNRVFDCDACGKVFQTYTALGGHKSSQCNGVNKRNKTPDDESQFSKLPKKPVTKEFKKPLKRRIVNDKKNGIVKVYHCTVKLEEGRICNKAFESGPALGGHQRAHRKKKEDESDAEVVDVRNQADLTASPPKEETEIEKVAPIRPVPKRPAVPPTPSQPIVIDHDLSPKDLTPKTPSSPISHSGNQSELHQGKAPAQQKQNLCVIGYPAPAYPTLAYPAHVTYPSPMVMGYHPQAAYDFSLFGSSSMLRSPCYNFSHSNCCNNNMNHGYPQFGCNMDAAEAGRPEKHARKSPGIDDNDV